MKIDSLLQGKYQSNDNMNTVKAHEKQARSASESLSYTLDISSKDKDITAYGMEELKSAEDIAAMASTKNVALESDANAVMSNSMSKEDFAEYLKEGYSPSNMEIDEIVTNLDKIKATLLESGVVINGYTDTISDSELDLITGSKAVSSIIKEALAENMLPTTESNAIDINSAINKSEEIKPLTDDAKKYLISNSMDTTIDNLYKAEYSSYKDTGKHASYYVDKTGYTSIRPADSDFEELRPQIEKILSDAEIEANEKSLNSAKWLLEKDLPITSENVKSLEKIDTINIPLKPETVAKSTAAAIADGYTAGSADITKDKSLIKRAFEINEEVSKYIDNLSEKEITNMRTVEEIRLRMSVEANLHLLKKGVSIDTKNLESLVENLRNAEKEIYKPLLLDEKEKESIDDKTVMDRIDLYKSTKSVIANVINNPLEAVITAASESSFTLEAVNKHGDSLKIDYEKAGKTYEALMTAPRSDLGDSIKKAFRNIDDILEDLDLELTKTNEKAVRSLSYVGMEINPQNIENAAKANTVVENVISLMTPRKTMDLIKNGINPLDMDMYELESELRKDSSEASDEKYSEFLLRLEKNGEINEQEKEAFIGFYRLFYKIKKSDGKLTGNILKADEKVTLNNLLVASRSNRTTIDAKVNDDFGYLDKLVTYGKSITDQIMQAFKDSPNNTTGSVNTDPYIDAKYEEMKEATFFDHEVEEALLKADSNVTTDNLIAMNQLMNNRGNIYKTITGNKGKNNGDSALMSRIRNFHDAFTSKDSADETYENLLDEANKNAEALTDSADSYVDLRSLKLVNKQISICSSLKNINSYEVPVEINGSITTINVKLIKDEENAGKVNISLCTDEYGKIISEMRLSDSNASMFVICENNAGTDYMKSIEESIKSEINSSGMKINTIYYSNKADININTTYTATSDRTPTNDLYNLAKAFIKAVHGSRNII